MSRKITITVQLSRDAHAGLILLADEWGMSQASTVELLIRRQQRMPPFENGPVETLAAIRAGEKAANSSGSSGEDEDDMEAPPGPMTAEERARHPELAAFVDTMGRELMSPGTGILATVASGSLVEVPAPAPEPEAPAAEPAPEAPPAPTNVGGGRVFTRNWYDDDAPEWVQLLGSEATAGEDLTAEQMAALNDWQAGVDREAPGAKP